MIEYHHFNQDGIYLGTTDADPDPRNSGEFMPPPFGATTEAPPQLGEHQAAKFDGGAWSVVPDLRGVVYWLPDRTQHVITDAGVELPAAALSEDPGPTTAELWAAHQVAAQAALDFNDRVAIRCIKAGVSYPAEWRNHDAALRAILRAESGDPSQPTPPHPVTFPPGT